MNKYGTLRNGWISVPDEGDMLYKFPNEIGFGRGE